MGVLIIGIFKFYSNKIAEPIKCYYNLIHFKEDKQNPRSTTFGIFFKPIIMSGQAMFYILCLTTIIFSRSFTFKDVNKHKQKKPCSWQGFVGVAGFEPATFPLAAGRDNRTYATQPKCFLNFLLQSFLSKDAVL